MPCRPGSSGKRSVLNDRESRKGGKKMMKMVRNVRRFIISILLGMVLLAGYSPSLKAVEASEPKYPTKPITILNSSPPGSPADIMARQVAQYAQKYLGQPIGVVTKPGGSGGVMFASLLADPADGYTISTITAGLLTSLHGPLKKDFSLDNFEFLVNVQKDDYCLAVRTDSPFKTLKDMIEYAKKNPPLKIGGQGTASALHLMVLLLAEQSGIRISWVPFAGGAESVTNLLGNHVPVINTVPFSVSQYVEAGKIRVLVTSGDQRLPQLKDVPTFKDLGYNIVMTQYRGFGAKKGLPPEVKAKLVDALSKAVAEPGFKNFLAKNFIADAFLGPEDFAALIRADYELMGRLMQKVEKKK